MQALSGLKNVHFVYVCTKRGGDSGGGGGGAAAAAAIAPRRSEGRPAPAFF
jgi:hypothetical protein